MSDNATRRSFSKERLEKTRRAYTYIYILYMLLMEKNPCIYIVLVQKTYIQIPPCIFHCANVHQTLRSCTKSTPDDVSGGDGSTYGFKRLTIYPP